MTMQISRKGYFNILKDHKLVFQCLVPLALAERRETQKSNYLEMTKIDLLPFLRERQYSSTSLVRGFWHEQSST